jgi:hypothetical protein
MNQQRPKTMNTGTRISTQNNTQALTTPLSSILTIMSKFNPFFQSIFCSKFK